MKPGENTVYGMTLQFTRNVNKDIPEKVIYGYVKLLLMDEGSKRNLLSDKELEELSSVRKLFEKKNLDLELIRSGLLLLLPMVNPTDRQQTLIKGFFDYLDKDGDNTHSTDIVSAALDSAVIPMQDIFSGGKTMTDVLAYHKELKAARDANAAGDKKDSADDKKPKADKGDTEEPDSANPKDDYDAKGKRKDHDEEGKVRSAVPDSDGEDKPLTFLELADKYHRLLAALLDVVKGQDPAVMKFVQGCFQGELLKHSNAPNRPQSYFFFFGPPGVGKTLLAETAASELKRPHMIFFMSEYSSHQSHEELIGTSKVYNNSREGILVKFVREHPDAILIFDEIEKAHLHVIRLFLQILGSGKLSNVHREEETDFSKTTIIFTSNVGKELYKDRSVNLTMLPEQVIVDAIKSDKNQSGEPVLPAELCSRIASGNTVMFNHLSTRHLADMTRLNFEKVRDAMMEEYGYTVTYDVKLPLLFLYHWGGELDGRIASGQSANFIKNEIYELARQIHNTTEEQRRIESIHLDIDKHMDEELKRLFTNSDKTEVMILADPDRLNGFSPDKEKYKIYSAHTIEEAKEYLNQDITAIFIDPEFGAKEGIDSHTLSAADYNTEGVAFFYEVSEMDTGIPIYLLDVGSKLSEIDRRSFIQEGAVDVFTYDPGNADSFDRHFSEIMDELYMERESVEFARRGQVIDFKTRQDIGDNGHIDIIFYGLKKRMAVDVESRDTLLSESERPDVVFDDVIGAGNAKEELKYFIEYLKNPKRFIVNGGKPPKGVLLYGPPGTGKTMLARAMAGESEVAFIQTSATEFKNMWVGESEANIRRVFAKAKRYAPAIIFIDEIDAIGKKRVGGANARAEESMLNALLTEMDGFKVDRKKPVFVLAATNYGVGEESEGIDSLDEALMRRFDNKIYVDLPDEKERKLFIERTLEKHKIKDVSEGTIKNLAERTTGQSLAILEHVIDLAFRAANKEQRTVSDKDLLTAIEEYMYGEKKDRTREYYESVAIHETGHAYVSYISGDEPSYITIESRGHFGGYMQHSNQEDTPSYTKDELLGRIRTALAGRAAEIVFYGEEKAINTGASSDLANATENAFRMLCSYGMADGSLVTLSRKEIMNSSLADKYTDRVNSLLEEQMKETINIVEGGRDTIKRIADELVKKNRLTGAEFKELMEKEEN